MKYTTANDIKGCKHVYNRKIGLTYNSTHCSDQLISMEDVFGLGLQNAHYSKSQITQISAFHPPCDGKCSTGISFLAQ